MDSASKAVTEAICARGLEKLVEKWLTGACLNSQKYNMANMDTHIDCMGEVLIDVPILYHEMVPTKNAKLFSAIWELFSNITVIHLLCLLFGEHINLLSLLV